MPQRINISGTIVGPSMDNYWWREEIDSGAITPSNRVISQLDACKDDVELVLNTPGGYVTDASSIAHAVRNWKASGKKSLFITVDAQAASCGGMILAQLCDIADEIRCYADSRVMFHSTTGGFWDAVGPEAMKDYAKTLDDINEPMIQNLIHRTKLEEDKVRTWFKEGRAGWLNAAELKECGLVDTVLDGAVTKSPRLDKKRQKALSAVGGMAAYCDEDDEEKAPAGPNNQPEDTNMPNANNTPGSAQVTKELTAEQQAAIRAEEKTRLLNIHKQCAALNCKEASDLEAKAIQEDWSTEKVATELLNIAVAKMGASSPQDAPEQKAQVPADSGEKEKKFKVSNAVKKLTSAFGVDVDELEKED